MSCRSEVAGDDERLDRWTDRLHWVKGKIADARDTAQLIATLPPEHVSRQVLRVAERLGLDHTTVTEAVIDTVSRDTDARGDTRDGTVATTSTGAAMRL